VVGNAEIRFPLFEPVGLYGTVFFDTGEAWGEDDEVDLGNLRESAGIGFRWRSPMGPIRLEYGWILDPQPTDEASGSWEFSMASTF
jgi:outer membrane protein insertion porin family